MIYFLQVTADFLLICNLESFGDCMAFKAAMCDFSGLAYTALFLLPDIYCVNKVTCL